MKTLTLTLFILIIPIICFANSRADEHIDQLIVFHTFSGDWARADSLLEAQISKYPDSPKYYALKGPYYFYTRYYNQGALDGDSLLQKMAEYSQKAIEIGEKEEMSLDDKFFVGTAYGYLSRFYGRQRSYWDAYWATSSCRSYLNDVLEEDPSYADAKMGLAVIEYFSATQVTGFWGFIAWVLGMNGDRDVALQQFHDVAENGHWFKYEGQFALAAVYRFFERDFEQARVLYIQLYDNFPQNVWIATQYDQLRFLSLVEEKGIEFLETEFDSLETKYQVTNPGVLNGFGYTLVFENRFNEAIEVFKINIKLFPEVANGFDSLSEAYALAGNIDMAIHYSRLCLEKISADSTINEAFRNNLREINEERLEELGANSDKLNI